MSFVKVNLFEVLGRYSSMVTDAVAELIFEAHRRGMSQTAAAEFAGVARDTVGRWWRSAGLKPLHRKHNALAEELAERMVEAYEAHGGNASAAAQAFGVSQSTVLKYWRASGLKPRGRPAALTEAQMARVAKAHGEHGGNASSAARALSLAPSTVRKIWKRAGLDPRQPGRPAGR